MKKLFAVFFIAAMYGLSCQGDLHYPRIANLYGSGIGWMDSEDGMKYWQKLEMIIGGGANWVNNFDSQDLIGTAQRAANTAALLKKINPSIIVLPYVDIREAPENQNIPPDFWKLDPAGKHMSAWPGTWLVDTAKPEVLASISGAVKKLIYPEKIWNGVFLDCWAPDKVLVPALKKAAPDKLIMVNDWNLPSTVSPLVNGALSEDELNRAAEGQADIRDIMDRYHRWMKNSAKPAISAISCYPRTIDPDPWRWSQLSQAQREAVMEAGRNSDLAMMRFGLCFTLMDDGFFAFDAGTQARGNWWWYPEYDAPIGTPKAACTEIRPAVWKRDYTGASVWVNGSQYDEPIHFKTPMKDFSTGRIAYDFILPRIDGRIFLPAQLPGNAKDNGILPETGKFFIEGSSVIIAETDTNGKRRIQYPDGLELYFGSNNLLESISWKGRSLLTGGRPMITLFDWNESKPALTSSNTNWNQSTTLDSFQGTVTWSDAKSNGFLSDTYSYFITKREDGHITLTIEDKLTALADFSPQMWRQYLMFPVSLWAGQRAQFSDSPSVKLPAVLGEEYLGNGNQIILDDVYLSLMISCNMPFTLIDHRKYGTQDFLWAAYPAGSNVKKGRTFFMEMKIEIAPKP
jgi:hypothetical protein